MMKRALSRLNVRMVGVGLGILSILVIITGTLIEHGIQFEPLAVFRDLWQNVGTDLGSIAITILVIDTLNQRRQEEAERQRDRDRLTRQLASSVNNEAKRAAEELRERGWLLDGTLLGVNLSEADLHDANLTDANLRGVSLRRANLQNVVLRGADLRDADLEDADLSNAVLENVQIERLNLNGTYLRGVKLEKPLGSRWDTVIALLTQPARDVDLSRRDLRYANLSGLRVINGVFLETMLYRTRLTDGYFSNVDFSSANFWGAVLRSAEFVNCRFVNANFHQADLSGARLLGAHLADANLSGANLTQAGLQNANFSHTDFTDAVLNYADLTGAILTSERQLRFARSLRGAVLPDGQRYDGRFALAGDREAAAAQGFDLHSETGLREYYGV
ncbi:MAG: pentapeptide repeat-containing protein [Anaerolineae bacterium]|nr:pentapeptide repeat-containing protein [Anaerolineae bacterium]